MTANLKPVDEVEILVLIDNQTDSLSSVPQGFTHEWVNLHNAGMEQNSGEIPRVTDYETGFPGHVCRTEDGTDWEDDPLLMDERYVAVNIAGKGLVVFSACSHAGIVNVLHAAQRDFPGVPIHGLTGGFHLAGGNEKIIGQTVADFAQFDIDLIMPGHCTGWRAANALER